MRDTRKLKLCDIPLCFLFEGLFSSPTNFISMLSDVYYLVRSKTDGNYLIARPDAETSGYLLLFQENFDALSYLNTHAAEVANRFAVESIARTQLGNLLKRWGFSGVGIVTDPLLPKVEFLQHN